MEFTEVELSVRFSETDQMGIAHHSNYPSWFEVGRTDFFKKMGVRYFDIEKMGILLPLSDLKCSFKRPARFEDEIVIKTSILKMSCVRLNFYYEVFNKESADLLAAGETHHAWTDSNFKPINLEKKNNYLYKLLLEKSKNSGCSVS